ncbi:MAG: hypothetical protein IKZ98_08070 [Clostridia bacterium]|nr:hypothetical protein [Clostridia bacterium]
MDTLANYRKMNIFFFGNEEEKKAFYLECICPFMEAHRKGQYYATREWNGGPNTEVVYAGEEIEGKVLRREIRRYCREKGLTWTAEQIQQNLKSYKKNQKTLLQMERKDRIPIRARNHLKVIQGAPDAEYYHRVYNSSEHVKLHFESKFLLQPLIEEALRTVQDKREMLLLAMKLFRMTMMLFEQGEKYASMVYFSNIEGFFGIAREYGKEPAFRQYFEGEYRRLALDQFNEARMPGNLEERFREAWEWIYKASAALAEEGKFSEEGYWQLKDQEAQMQSNIRNLDSPFHRAFRQDRHLHEIVSGKIHLTFRSVTNILYNLMPALNISFLEKNLCCYAVVRYIMDKYNTTWQEIMAERVI